MLADELGFILSSHFHAISLMGGRRDSVKFVFCGWQH